MKCTRCVGDPLAKFAGGNGKPFSGVAVEHDAVEISFDRGEEDIVQGGDAHLSWRVRGLAVELSASTVLVSARFGQRERVGKGSTPLLRGETSAPRPPRRQQLRMDSGATGLPQRARRGMLARYSCGGNSNEEDIREPVGRCFIAGRHIGDEDSSIRTEQGGIEHAESGGYGARLLVEIFRWERLERSEAQRLPGKEECRPGVLRVRFYRGLNAANEKLPAESAEAGSSRHPGPGCEHG